MMHKNQPTTGTEVMESPESYGVSGVKSKPTGDRKGGIVWHTQGSGKSLSMVFYTGKIVLASDNPTILVITDRNDLDDTDSGILQDYLKSLKIFSQIRSGQDRVVNSHF